MTWIEVSAKTLEEAKKTAALELGAPVDQIVVEVLSEETKGFLGLGQPKVLIRASVMDSASEQLETPPVEEYGVSMAGERALAFLQQILQNMGFDARPVLVLESPEEVQIEISGESDDIGRLIGRRGQTLDALQYLLGIVVNRETPNRVRVLLDAEGYRERHARALEARVVDLARQVAQSGEEAVLEPQSARDRRTVHMVLADHPDVVTYSEGEGDYRHIVISPRK